MKIKTGTLLSVLFWSLFMGITAISIGLGAAIPSLNRITQPFVCPAGKMDLEKETYHPYPGNTVTTITWYCTDRSSGERTELGVFPMVLYSGILYGLGLFAVIFVIMLMNANRHPAASDLPSRREALNQLNDASDTLSRMKELKELRAANLISETEYEAKRAEILKGL